MQDILSKLHTDATNYNFSSRTQNEVILKIAREKRDIMEKLIASLDDTEKELFEAYRKAEYELEDRIRYNALLGAIKFGSLFISDKILLAEDLISEEDESGSESSPHDIVQG